MVKQLEAMLHKLMAVSIIKTIKLWLASIMLNIQRATKLLVIIHKAFLSSESFQRLFWTISTSLISPIKPTQNPFIQLEGTNFNSS